MRDHSGDITGKKECNGSTNYRHGESISLSDDIHGLDDTITANKQDQPIDGKRFSIENGSNARKHDTPTPNREREWYAKALIIKRG